MLKRFFYNYFNFSKSERIAFYVIISLIFLVIGLNFFIPFIQTQQKTDFSKFLKEIELLENQNNTSDSSTNEEFDMVKDEAIKDNFKIFYFDPNKIGLKEWKSLGVSDYSANRIEKYKSKGGKIRKIDDLKKFQGMNDRWFFRIKDYVVIEQNIKDKTQYQKQPEDKIVESIDINLANKESLIKIRGIGNTFAERIIKYRNLLGGFHSIEQLREVYGIDRTRYSNLKDYFHIAVPELTKIALNMANYKQMEAHPYNDKQQAKAIIDYRIKHGPFKSMEEFSNSGIFTDDFMLNRLLPYLKLWE